MNLFYTTLFAATLTAGGAAAEGCYTVEMADLNGDGIKGTTVVLVDGKQVDHTAVRDSRPCDPIDIMFGGGIGDKDQPESEGEGDE